MDEQSKRRRRKDGFTARTKQRNRALDVVFEADERGLLGQGDLLALLDERKVVSTSQSPIGDFGASIVEAYAENADDIDTIVEAASEDWAMSRMNAKPAHSGMTWKRSVPTYTSSAAAARRMGGLGPRVFDGALGGLRHGSPQPCCGHSRARTFRRPRAFRKRGGGRPRTDLTRRRASLVALRAAEGYRNRWNPPWFRFFKPVLRGGEGGLYGRQGARPRGA